MTKKNAALTLIEFLLAFAIFGIIALCLYGTFFSGLQISKRSENFEKSFRSIRWTLDTIQFDLENMVPYHSKDQNPSNMAFSGSNKDFSLVVPTDSGLKRIHYFLVDPQNAHIHTVQIGQHTSKNVAVTTNQMSNQQQTSYLIRQEQGWGQKVQDEVLNKQIIKNSLKISYGFMDKDVLTWTNEWKDDFFPLSVRFQIAFLDPENPKHSIPIQKTIIIPTGLWGKFTNDTKNQK